VSGFVPVWSRLARIDLWTTARFGFFEKCRPRRNVCAFFLGLDPWERTLPWAVVIISQTAAVVGDHVRGFVCAKAVDAGTRRSVGTSVIVRIPSACVWCGAGRLPNARPSVAKTRRPKLSMPRPSKRAADEPHLRHNPLTKPKLRLRVVTQQQFFRRLPFAIGPAVIRRPPSRAATRPSIAVGPVVRRFTGCSIVSVSGCSAALFRAAALASGSTRPPACGGAVSHALRAARLRPQRRQRKPLHRPEPVHSRWP